MEISEMLKEKRKEYQLTQEELAEKIFVSNKTISNWENDKTKPDIESLILLAKLFDLSLDNLLLEESEMVKAMNQDIHRGRNLKKILLVVSLPLIVVILLLSWITYKGNHLSIVPLNDVEQIELSTKNLNKETEIKGKVKLKPYESVAFVDTVVKNKMMYVMIHKKPQLIGNTNEFTFSLNEKLQSDHHYIDQIEKIVLTYYDTREVDGFTNFELTQSFPEKVIWKK